jgi:hypothetical protein
VTKILLGNIRGPAGSQGEGLTGNAIQHFGGPSYTYPTWFVDGGGVWQDYQEAAPYMSIVIANPASGPGDTANTDYVAQIRLMRAAGMTVLGYISTAFTANSQSSVEAQIDAWHSLYDTELADGSFVYMDGIFFDECSVEVIHQPYYQALCDYTKSKPGRGLVLINPGTTPDESYMSACDILCNFEGDIGQYRGFASTSHFIDWLTTYPSSRFLHVVYGCWGTKERDEALRLSREQRAGLVWITDGTLPNPYDTEPGSQGGPRNSTPAGLSYFTDMIKQLAAVYPEDSWDPVVEDSWEGFDGQAFSALWTVPSGSTAVVAGQKLQLTCTTSGNDHLDSASTFNFTGLRAEVEAVTLPVATNPTTLMKLQKDASNYLAIGQSSGNLLMRSRNAGSNSDTTLSYDGFNHKWWKISLVSGTATWYTSADGETWTSRRTVSSSLPDMTAVTYILSTSRTTGSNETVDFDNALCVDAAA